MPRIVIKRWEQIRLLTKKDLEGVSFFPYPVSEEGIKNLKEKIEQVEREGNKEEANHLRKHLASLEKDYEEMLWIGASDEYAKEILTEEIEVRINNKALKELEHLFKIYEIPMMQIENGIYIDITDAEANPYE